MNITNNKWRFDVVRPPSRDRDPERRQAIDMLDAALRKLPGRPALALIVLSNDDKVFYAMLKYVTVYFLSLFIL
jgi:hypothetical protein